MVQETLEAIEEFAVDGTADRQCDREPQYPAHLEPQDLAKAAEGEVT